VTDHEDGAAEPRWLDDDQQHAWRQLAAVVLKLPSELESQLQRDAGMSHFEYWVVALLSEAPDRTLRMSQLAAQANASLSRLSHVVSRLEKRGWVTRRPCPDDARATLAVLTDAGWEQVVAAAPAMSPPSAGSCSTDSVPRTSASWPGSVQRSWKASTPTEHQRPPAEPTTRWASPRARRRATVGTDHHPEGRARRTSMICEHLQQLGAVEPTSPRGCEECLATGQRWVHLRLCMGCGHVGCCDSSPGRHATAHARSTDHPVVQSFEQGEDWAYCYPDEEVLEHVAPELARSVTG
jgi:DNA-binding MarR family transcriptional regulator